MHVWQAHLADQQPTPPTPSPTMTSMTDDAVLVSKHVNSTTLSKLRTAGVDTSAYGRAHKAWHNLRAHSTAKTTDVTRIQLLIEKRELLSKLCKLRAGVLEAQVSELQEAASTAVSSSNDTTKALEPALELSRKNDARQSKVQACVRQVAATADHVSEMATDRSTQPNNAPAKHHPETELDDPVVKQRQTEEPAQSQQDIMAASEAERANVLTEKAC